MLRLLRKMMGALVLSALVLSLLTPAMAASVATTMASSGKVYASASTSSASLTLKKGTGLTIKGISGSWAKVERNGLTGYVELKNLDKSSRACYINRKTYVYSKASSTSSKRSVGVNTKVYIVGKSGDYYRVQSASGSARGYVKASCLSRNKVAVSSVADSAAWKAKVVKMDWFHGGNNVMKKGSYAYLYDTKTGIVMRIKRMGGHNHADVEPATAADTDKLLEIAGGKFSWDSHATILVAGGKYVACAINTLPHGDQTIHNNHYEGQFCLHMCDSTTHGTGKVNDKHQAAIEAAYKWAHAH